MWQPALTEHKLIDPLKVETLSTTSERKDTEYEMTSTGSSFHALTTRKEKLLKVQFKVGTRRNNWNL